MLLHIPHSSTAFPEHYSSIPALVSIYKETDWFTHKLFSGYMQYIFPYSRFYCDVERLITDTGNGIIYTIDNDGSVYRELDHSEKESIYKIYADWHLEMKRDAEYRSCYYDHVVVVDCHSYSAEQVGMSEHEVPDICIGLNDDNAPPLYVIQGVAEIYLNAGYSVRFNFPYANAVKVTDISNVFSIMIEVNKRLYLTQIPDEPPTLSVGWERLKQTNDAALKYLVEFEVGPLTVQEANETN